jgi:hypothetical protein
LKRALISVTAALALVIGLTHDAAARGGGRSAHSSSSHSYTSHRSSKSSSGEHYTKGYTKKDGTHVQGHYQTNPNHTKNDNYSTRGNVNPHTGKPGTKPRDGD